ncbi:MAG: tRNA (adenosine(37)-N6)-threonylcarbamoyltransferase complex dimerization subunit type 1 TsaB [Firmicutes bacterium]|nr:tRNA (adenosine(37)-N6)-threonylcarbamoyltransferase complex dimerization subunit type 1 TsaB [Bacillota bacterium]
MAIVALDTATPTLSVAIGDESGRVLGQWTTLAPRMHATQLHPVIDALLSSLSLDVTDVRGVLVGVGPGSYTGVRLGVTAAKSLAYALHIPVVGVSSMLAASFPLCLTEQPVGVLFDARRNEAYVGLYGPTAQGWGPLMAEARVPYEEAIGRMAEIALALHSSRLWLVGDGATIAAAKAQECETQTEIRVYDDQSQVLAPHIYQAGIKTLRALLTAPEEDAYEQRAHALVPRYLQLAEAETRWRERQQEGGASGSE